MNANQGPHVEKPANDVDEIPTLIGNIVGGIAFTGLMLYSTHVRTGATRSQTLAAGVRRPIAAE